MLTKTNLIIFTDLDGSFLDHNNYDYSAALPALSRLKSLGSQVIPTTSKTLAELQSLNLPFGESPQIAENGMVIFDGREKRHVGKSYQDIITFIQGVPDRIRGHINGFNDMSIEDVVSHTSLSPDNARLAKDRLGSEPFLWSGNDVGLAALKEEAAGHGLQVVRGGRFYHLMSAGGGKNVAIETLLDGQDDVVTIALGDGPNDADMLGVVDYGIKIPNSRAHDFSVQNPKGDIIDAPAEGPEGWNAAINCLLDRLRF